jgi:hypothetical protein
MTSPLSAAARAFAGTARVWLRGTGPTTLGSPAAAAALTRAQLLYVGETHEQPHVLRLQMALLDAVIAARPAAVHLVLEHFTFPEQATLDALLAPGVAIPAGADAPRTAEGFSGVLAVLAFAKVVAAAAGVPLRAYAAFPPRDVARRFAVPKGDGSTPGSGGGTAGSSSGDGGAAAAATADGPAAAAWADMVTRRWLGDDAAFATAHRDTLLVGSDAHFAFFNALIQGEGEADGAVWGADSSSGSGGGFRRIFPAQVVKDAAAALTVARAWSDLPRRQGPGAASSDDGATAISRDGVVVVLAGTGHVDYSFGIPERVSTLLQLPRHVPASTAPAAAAHGDTTPAQLIVTVRPLPEGDSGAGEGTGGGASGDRDGEGDEDAAGAAPPPARITFPDGTTRQAGDLLYLFRYVEDEAGAV